MTEALTNGATDRDDEIDLRAYAASLWKWRYAIVAVTVVSGLAAFGYASLTPPTFEAKVQLIVMPPKSGEQVTTGAGVATFRALLDSPTLASQVMHEAGLEKAPYHLTPYAFLNQCVAIQNIADTNLITVRITMPDAALAADVANRYAAKGVDVARRVIQNEGERAQQTIKMQVDESRGALDSAEATLGDFKRQAQVELVKRDVDALLDERVRLLTLTIESEGEKARLKKAEEDLSKEEPSQRGSSALDLGASLNQAAAEQSSRERAGRERVGGEEVSSARPPSLRSDVINPYLNPVHELLRQQVAMSRTRVAGLERQRAELIARLKLDAPTLARLGELYGRQIQLARLETEYDLAKKVYTETATRYQEARLQVAGLTPQLQVFAQALAPERPIAPRPMRSAALGFVVGFVLSTFTAIILGAVLQVSGRLNAPTGGRVG